MSILCRDVLDKNLRICEILVSQNKARKTPSICPSLTHEFSPAHERKTTSAFEGLLCPKDPIRPRHGLKTAEKLQKRFELRKKNRIFFLFFRIFALNQSLKLLLRFLRHLRHFVFNC